MRDRRPSTIPDHDGFGLLAVGAVKQPPFVVRAVRFDQGDTHHRAAHRARIACRRSPSRGLFGIRHWCSLPSGGSPTALSVTSAPVRFAAGDAPAYAIGHQSRVSKDTRALFRAGVCLLPLQRVGERFVVPRQGMQFRRDTFVRRAGRKSLATLGQSSIVWKLGHTHSSRPAGKSSIVEQSNSATLRPWRREQFCSECIAALVHRHRSSAVILTEALVTESASA